MRPLFIGEGWHIILMDRKKIDEQIEALDSVSVKLEFRNHGIKIDNTEEEHDALVALRDWFINYNFDCPKCGQLLNKEREIDKFTDKQKKTFICPCCSKESNIAELK